MLTFAACEHRGHGGLTPGHCSKLRADGCSDLDDFGGEDAFNVNIVMEDRMKRLF